MPKLQSLFGLSGQHRDATHMLLYLNEHTFLGLRGQLLAHELRTARKHHIQIVLVHEQDPERGGCAFDRFFETTPEDLVIDGLYKKIANACHTGPHRDVSLALIIKVMGAVEEQSTWCSRIGLQRKKTPAEAEEHQRTALVPVPRDVQTGDLMHIWCAEVERAYSINVPPSVAKGKQRQLRIELTVPSTVAANVKMLTVTAVGVVRNGEVVGEMSREVVNGALVGEQSVRQFKISSMLTGRRSSAEEKSAYTPRGEGSRWRRKAMSVDVTTSGGGNGLELRCANPILDVVSSAMSTAGEASSRLSAGAGRFSNRLSSAPDRLSGAWPGPSACARESASAGDDEDASDDEK